MMDSADNSSTRPYLIRALHEWCSDNGLTPFIAVLVDDSVRVPKEYVKNGEIVLNVSYEATGALRLGNEFIEFKGRFGGVPRDILVPVDRVVAIYARENGQGMAFPILATSTTTPDTPSRPSLASVPPHLPDTETDDDDDTHPPPVPSTGGGKPALKRVK